MARSRGSRAHRGRHELRRNGRPRLPGRRPRNCTCFARPGDVVVISGGARGITAEVAAALAASFGPRLVLLGRTPAPEREPGWLAALSDEAEIRRAIRDHAEGPCTPQVLNERLRLVQSQREIRRNLERIRAAGAEVSYHAVDVRDRKAVKDLLDQVRRQFGPIRGLVHGAGVLADRLIEDQTDAQFGLVHDTKVCGLHALHDAIDPEQLAFLVLFSSSTARFGRAGQVAYAAANEALNKWAQRAARRLPECRVVALNWGPWDGGMVTASLKPLFEREGLGLIPLEAGGQPGRGRDQAVRTSGRSRSSSWPRPDPARRSPTCPTWKPRLHRIRQADSSSWCSSARSTSMRCR